MAKIPFRLVLSGGGIYLKVRFYKCVLFYKPRLSVFLVYEAKEGWAVYLTITTPTTIKILPF